MAARPVSTLGSAGIDQLGPTQLLRTARLFAADPTLPTLLDLDEGEARWVELDSSADLDVWLLSWPVGTYNGWHDHGESAGAFQVVRGTLLEQTSDKQRREFRTIVAGEGRSFQPHQIHHLANVRNSVALSVHVYAPRLTTTERYAITPTGLQSRAVAEAGLVW